MKDEAKNILSEYDSKVSKSKEEIKNLISSAKNQAEKNIIKTNEDFHKVIENRKKSAEEKIKQMKIRAIKDVKNSSVDKVVTISEDIVSSLLKDIFGEDGNRSSIKATVSEVIKRQRITKL